MVVSYRISHILFPFVCAGVLVYVCTPPIGWLAHHTRAPRWIYAVLVLLASMSVAALIGWLGLPPLIKQVTHAGGNLQGSLSGMLQQLLGKGTINLLGTPVNAHDMAQNIINGLHQLLRDSTRMLTLLGYGFAGMFGFILCWVLLGYLLVAGGRTGDQLFWLIPPSHRPFAHRVWRDLHNVLWRYFVGVALVVVYASTPKAKRAVNFNLRCGNAYLREVCTRPPMPKMVALFEAALGCLDRIFGSGGIKL